MRATSAGAVLLAVAGCSSGQAPDVAQGSEHIACALGRTAQFVPVCAVDRAAQGAEKTLVVRHPDGGFRRFAVLTDGHGLAAADGAAIAQVAIAGGLLEVRVDDDRYRFPFTVKSHAAH